MKKTLKSRYFIFVLGVCLVFFLQAVLLAFWHVRKNLQADSLYSTYVEHYVKTGTAERTFMEGSPLKPTLTEAVSGMWIHINDRMTEDGEYTEQDWWYITFRVENVSDEPYIYTKIPMELDYLVDDEWYLCRYGDTEAVTTQIKYTGSAGTVARLIDPVEYILEPGGFIDYRLDIYEPLYGNFKGEPFISGRFWYGHYRLVLEWEEGKYQSMEFDFPETGVQTGESLYLSEGK